jgi:adhesin transport system membrane fusion protein
MNKFADMSEFHQGYQFFMLRPSRAVKSFIFTLASIVSIAVIWALFAVMDDVVKANVLIRPAESISLVKAVSGGEVLQKNYTHGASVHEGQLLFQLDVSADILELDNSEKLMSRVNDSILLYNALLETIRSGINRANPENSEAFIRSESYLIENRRYRMQIEEARVKLEREESLPETLALKQRLEDMVRESEQAELQFSSWKSTQTIEAMETLKTLLQNKESLERRMTDLERNIKNATLRAPISGKVNEIRKLNIGDYVLPGEEIITIVPSDAVNLKAELYIEPAYIAQVKIGQKATLRFPGLPPSKFGKLDADITLIPADYAMGSGSDPAFIVEAAIKEPWLLSPQGERIYLRPGIGAIGRVIIDQDTVMRMLLKKLDFINDSYDKDNLKKDK